MITVVEALSTYPFNMLIDRYLSKVKYYEIGLDNPVLEELPALMTMEEMRGWVYNRSQELNTHNLITLLSVSMEALAKKRPEWYTQFVVSCLKHKSEDVRYTAISVLGHWAQEAFIPALVVRLMEEPQPYIQEHITEAIQDIKVWNYVK